MKTFLHKKIRAFFLLVMLLLSLFTFLGSTTSKNKVLSDGSRSVNRNLDVVSETTNNSPPQAVPNNFSLNWENEHFQKNAFRTFLQRISIKDDDSETLSPIELKKIVNLSQTIIEHFQVSSNKKNQKIQLKLFEKDFDEETKFNQVIIWFMKLYHQIQKTNINFMGNENFNPQDEKNHLLKAVETLINFEEIYLNIKTLSDCELIPGLECISVATAFKPNVKKKAINYQTFIKVLYSISKWIYVHLKDELAWKLNPDGTLDLNWEKNALLLTKLEENPFLSQILKTEIIDILLEKIQFQFYDSENKTFSKDSLLKFMEKHIKKNISWWNPVSLLTNIFDVKNIIKNFVREQENDLGKTAYNILKNFMKVTLILREFFAKNTIDYPQKFQIKNFLTILLRFLQTKNKNELNDENIKILIRQILNIVLNFNRKIFQIWNPQPKIKTEIQNLLNDYAQPFYHHLQEVTESYQEYVWEHPKKLSFLGIIMPYIGNKSAEDNKILTIQWISSDGQKYTVALQKKENNRTFDVLYFAPNHWINPLQKSLQSYITKL